MITENEVGAMSAYLAANPGKTPRDYKGKDTAPFDQYYVGPGEQPFDRLNRDYVRGQVDGVPARLLPRNLRQAAGRDPALVWDDAARAYRLAPAKAPEKPRSTRSQYLDLPGAGFSPPASAPAGLAGIPPAPSPDPTRPADLKVFTSPT